MTQFNKKSLALAISAAVLGMGFSGAAVAFDMTQSLDQYGKHPGTIHYAKEIKADDTTAVYPANTSVAGAAGPLDLKAYFGARVVAGQPYYVRFDFTGATLDKTLNDYNYRMTTTTQSHACNTPATPLSYIGAAGKTLTTDVLCDLAVRNTGTGNAGDSFVVYHLKANTSDRIENNTVGLLLNTQINDATNTTTLGTTDSTPLKITKKDGVTVQYRLYDKQAQALAGEAAGVFASVGPYPYIDFNYASFTFKGTEPYVHNSACVASGASDLKIDVATESTKFEGGADLVCLGRLELSEVSKDENNNTLTIYNKDGVDIGAATVNGTIDVLKSNGNTKLIVSGDFAAAKSGGKVYYSTSHCGTSTQAATTVTDTSAEWVIGNKELEGTGGNTGVAICMQVNGTTTIAGGKYTASLSPEADTGYVVEGSEVDLGTLKRNGAILQSPFFNMVDGYVARFYLTNTGKTEAKFTVNLGSDTAAGALTPGTVTSGTIPAGGAILLKSSDIANGGQRGFAEFQIQAPAENIEGVFQFRNTASGDFDSYVMVKK